MIFLYINSRTLPICVMDWRYKKLPLLALPKTRNMLITFIWLLYLRIFILLKIFMAFFKLTSAKRINLLMVKFHALKYCKEDPERGIAFEMIKVNEIWINSTMLIEFITFNIWKSIYVWKWVFLIFHNLKNSASWKIKTSIYWNFEVYFFQWLLTISMTITLIYDSFQPLDKINLEITIIWKRRNILKLILFVQKNTFLMFLCRLPGNTWFISLLNCSSSSWYTVVL